MWQEEVHAERITYRGGQLLAGADLRDDRARDAALRGLHTRYLHGTWGIALGLEVNVAAEGKAVVVGPGYAVDGLGRDVLLSEAIQVGLPQAPGRFVLMLEDEVAAPSGGARGCGCTGNALHSRAARPAVAWRTPEAMSGTVGVPVVLLQAADGTLQGELDGRVRRYARAMRRPHVGRGVTEPGQWESWTEPGQENLGIRVSVDTADAGFRTTPAYLAFLQGDFAGLATPADPETWSFGAGAVFSPAHFGFLSGASADGFTYRILSGAPPFGLPATAAEAKERTWSVCWIGVEPAPEAEPGLGVISILSPLQVVTLFGWALPPTNEDEP